MDLRGVEENLIPGTEHVTLLLIFRQFKTIRLAMTHDIVTVKPIGTSTIVRRARAQMSKHVR